MGALLRRAAHVRRVVLVIGIAVAGLGIVAAASAPADTDATRFPLGTTAVQDTQSLLLEARIKGDENAAITVLEISDFQCPYCRVFWEETLPVLMGEYVETGKIRFVFLNMPLANLHPNAPAAHEFAMCAAAQDRFWPVHDLLFQHQETWAALEDPSEDPSEYFLVLADSANLAMLELAACFQNGTVRQLIEQEVALNARSGITSTPSFVIERGLLRGVHPIETWRSILDSLVAARAAETP
jgi:protein-disulfide isomerase